MKAKRELDQIDDNLDEEHLDDESHHIDRCRDADRLIDEPRTPEWIRWVRRHRASAARVRSDMRRGTDIEAQAAISDAFMQIVTRSIAAKFSAGQ